MIFVVRRIEIEDFYRHNGEVCVFTSKGTEISVDTPDEAKELLQSCDGTLGVCLGWMEESDFALLEDKNGLTILNDIL